MRRTSAQCKSSAARKKDFACVSVHHVDTMRSMDKRSPGTRIRDARIARGLSQSDLARAIHRSPHSVSRYESDETELSLDLAQRIAYALDMTTSTLFGEVGR